MVVRIHQIGLGLQSTPFSYFSTLWGEVRHFMRGSNPLDPPDKYSPAIMWPRGLQTTISMLAEDDEYNSLELNITMRKTHAHTDEQKLHTHIRMNRNYQ